MTSASVTVDHLDIKYDGPSFSSSAIIVDLSKSVGKTYWKFDDDQDVIFVGSKTPLTTTLKVDGGRNIALLGGDFRPDGSAKNSATLSFANVHGDVYIEGVHVDNGATGERDGIGILGAAGHRPSITIQNSLIENISGSRGGVHGDIFQTYGMVDQIRMFNVTGSSNYQGFFIAPQSAGGNLGAAFENVNLKYLPGGDPHSYLYWFYDNADQTRYPIELNNVFAEQRDGIEASQTGVWPTIGAEDIGAVLLDGLITWPSLPIEGAIHLGRPSADFVTLGNLGKAYDVAEALARLLNGNADAGHEVVVTPVVTHVVSSVTCALEPLAEQLTLTGSASINGYGNALDNQLFGNVAANVLNGRGGADLMQGGGGNDVYFVDNSGDRIVEARGEGLDQVRTTTSYKLEVGQQVEQLIVSDQSGTTAINLTGNEFGNAIRGNAGANAIDGGAGSDTLFGLGGDDIYLVDSYLDRVIEHAGQGFDEVRTVGSYRLGAGQEIESLIAANGASTSAISLFGNEFSNALTGNAGKNVLNGLAGADTMSGLAGDDKYYVDDSADVIIERAEGGADVVYASASYTLGAGVAVETLFASDVDQRTAINLVGNEFANSIRGNAGSNLLNGGAGNDVLYGLGGRDVFVFDTIAVNNVDRIRDFYAPDDTIWLAKDAFPQLDLGALDSNAFKLIRGHGDVVDADDRIIYDFATKSLFYDADGSGSAAEAIQFAILDNRALITHSDFMVI